MKTKLLSGLLVAVVFAGVTVYRPATDVHDEAGQIDFASLHDQANSAMRTLQLSQERRLAFQQFDTAEF